jgi:UDP-2,3-diacylglucosamine hydrolase
VPGNNYSVKTFLISDLHLSSQRPAVTNAFKHFLKSRRDDCEALYILGDLFEAWIGDDDPAPLARDIINELKVLTEHGTPIYFQHGNRDFALGKRFILETGCTLLAEHCLVDLYGKSVLLLHGDTLCTEDKDYQRARKFIRNPLLLWAMKSLPLRIRQQIGKLGRKKSIAAVGQKPEYIMDVSQPAVMSLLQQYGTSTMIHGHTHRPATHQFFMGKEEASRIVLGAWHEQAWVVEASPAGMELQSFNIQD